MYCKTCFEVNLLDSIDGFSRSARERTLRIPRFLSLWNIKSISSTQWTYVCLCKIDVWNQSVILGRIVYMPNETSTYTIYFPCLVDCVFEWYYIHKSIFRNCNFHIWWLFFSPKQKASGKVGEKYMIWYESIVECARQRYDTCTIYIRRYLWQVIS